MEIPHTEKKLREAHFFFDHLLKVKDGFPADTEGAEYFLSAFLSAARSVTFVLEAEQKTLYNSWFPTWLSGRSTEDQELLSFMNDQRVREVHVRGAKTTTRVEWVPVTEVPTERGRHPAYGFHWSGPPGVPPPEVGRQVLHFEIDEAVGEEITERCQRYLNLLDELVAEFLKHYRDLPPKT